MKLCLVLFCVSTLALSFRAKNKFLPNFIKPCKENEPNISTCYANVIEALRPHLAQGITEHGLDPIDPVTIARMSFSEKHSEKIRYEGYFENMVITGTKHFRVIKTDTPLPTKYAELSISFNKTLWNLDVHGNASLLGFVVNGSFKVEANFTNLVLGFILDSGDPIDDGKTYMKWRPYFIDVSYDNVDISVKGLNQDEATLNIYNQNLRKYRYLLSPYLKRGTFALAEPNLE